MGDMAYPAAPSRRVARPYFDPPTRAPFVAALLAADNSAGDFWCGCAEEDGVEEGRDILSIDEGLRDLSRF